MLPVELYYDKRDRDILEKFASSHGLSIKWNNADLENKFLEIKEMRREGMLKIHHSYNISSLISTAIL